jgi:hypothetical protein
LNLPRGRRAKWSAEAGRMLPKTDEKRALAWDFS